jgi:hypothetical protein
VPTEDARRVYHDSHWADPDQAEAVMHLRRLADDAGARKALGAQGREATRRCLGASPLSAAIRGIGLALPH